MQNAPVELKGSNFTLSVAYLNSPDPKVIFDALVKKMRQAPAFLVNAPVVLNISALPLDSDIVAIKDAFTQAGLVVVGITGCKNEQQKRDIAQAKLALLTEGKTKKTTASSAAAKPNFTPSMIVSSPVRTGQQIYARNSDLIVTSHVSAGAEIIADGNIHVYGLLRGRALAGANNNDKAQIFCTQLAAELVSIAGQYWLSDQIPAEYYEKAVQLAVQDNLLTINYLK